MVEPRKLHGVEIRPEIDIEYEVTTNYRQIAVLTRLGDRALLVIQEFLFHDGFWGKAEKCEIFDGNISQPLIVTVTRQGVESVREIVDERRELGQELLSHSYLVPSSDWWEHPESRHILRPGRWYSEVPGNTFSMYGKRWLFAGWVQLVIFADDPHYPGKKWGWRPHHIEIEFGDRKPVRFDDERAIKEYYEKSYEAQKQTQPQPKETAWEFET